MLGEHQIPQGVDLIIGGFEQQLTFLVTPLFTLPAVVGDDCLHADAGCQALLQHAIKQGRSLVLIRHGCHREHQSDGVRHGEGGEAKQRDH